MSAARALPAVALLALGAAAVAVLYAGGSAMGPTPADAEALRESLQLRTPDLTAAAVVLTDVGGTVSMTVLALLVGAWSYARGRVPDAVLAVGAMAFGAAIFQVLKVVIDRQRPPELTRLVMETNESLPSGHATLSMVVIGTLVALGWAGRGPLGRVAMVVAGALWVGTVGLTRIYLGVHWLTDVVAGWLVGATWLTVCVVVWSWWRRRSEHRARDAVHL